MPRSPSAGKIAGAAIPAVNRRAAPPATTGKFTEIQSIYIIDLVPMSVCP